jgi:glutamate formiminotransferase
VIECVVNVSEGRDMAMLRALADACGAALLDVHTDPDHNRTVFTLGGPSARDAQVSARALARTAARRLDIVGHTGVHPYIGAIDVVPFVPVGPTTTERDAAIDAAVSFARWWASAYDVPVFLYGDADPQGRDLPSVRRGAFTSRQPDYGPPEPHPRLGASAVGARRPLVAINCMLVSDEVDKARRIARRIRESDGGLPAVRALGFMLDTAGRAQVSMNLFDLDRTGVEHACRAVRVEARKEHTDVAEIELVGLVPSRELDRCSDEFLRWSRLDASCTIEGRVGIGPRWLPGDEPPSR